METLTRPEVTEAAEELAEAANRIGLSDERIAEVIRKTARQMNLLAEVVHVGANNE
jgi:hypothetical protein